MDTVDPFRVFLALLFVISLIGLLAFVLKRMASSKSWPLKTLQSGDPNSRLQIIETRFLDPRRKLVLIRRDKTEHLLLLCDGRELVIETNIHAPEQPDN